MNNPTNTCTRIYILFMDDDELIIWCDSEYQTAVKLYATQDPTASHFEVTDNDGEYFAIPSSYIKYMSSQVIETKMLVNPFDAIRTMMQAAKSDKDSLQ